LWGPVETVKKGGKHRTLALSREHKSLRCEKNVHREEGMKEMGRKKNEKGSVGSSGKTKQSDVTGGHVREKKERLSGSHLSRRTTKCGSLDAGSAGHQPVQGDH